MSRLPRTLLLALATILVLTACARGHQSGPSASTPARASRERRAVSRPRRPRRRRSSPAWRIATTKDNHRWIAARMIEDEVEAADVGSPSRSSEPASSVATPTHSVRHRGRHRHGIQGASALSAVYAPMSVVDGASVFDDSDDLHNFFSSEASDPLMQGFEDEIGVHPGAWKTALASSTRMCRSAPGRPCGPPHGFPTSHSPDKRRAMGAEPVEVLRGAVPGPRTGYGRRTGEPDHEIVSTFLAEVQEWISSFSYEPVRSSSRLR